MDSMHKWMIGILILDTTVLITTSLLANDFYDPALNGLQSSTVRILVLFNYIALFVHVIINILSLIVFMWAIRKLKTNCGDELVMNIT